MSYSTINKFRKHHRFLGIFIGIQFLFWTISGLYFSWTDIDLHKLGPTIRFEYLKETKKNMIKSHGINDLS